MLKFESEFNKTSICFFLGRSWYDNYKVFLFFPEVLIGRYTPSYEEDGKEYGIKFLTEIRYETSTGFRFFRVRVLGFGIGFSRQYSY